MTKTEHLPTTECLTGKILCWICVMWRRLKLHADPLDGSIAGPSRRVNAARLFLYFISATAFIPNVFSQTALTVVSDTLNSPAGGHPSGSITVSWARYQDDSVPRRVLFPGSTIVPVVNGLFTVSLFPNSVALPVSGCYSISYHLSSGSGLNNQTRYWYVPVSATPVNLNVVETSLPCPTQSGVLISPGQIAGGNAQIGWTLVWNGYYFSPAPGGGSGSSPGGTNGQIQFNSAGAFGGFTLAGDCILSNPNIICTKTNGIAFAASATTDTTDAANISSGVLALARGGTATGTVFTQGSVVFAGASGVYSQNNANLFWNNSTNTLSATNLSISGSTSTTIISSSPGFFDNSQFLSNIDARVGSGSLTNPDTAQQAITNAVGAHRPLATSGTVVVPNTASVYEADAVAGTIVNNSSATNAVAGSFFATLGQNAPSGTVNTSGTAVTRVTGDPFNTAWGNTPIEINGLQYIVSTSTITANSLTLTTSAGTQTGSSYLHRIFSWAINTLATDTQPGAMGAPIYSGAELLNEFDFNAYNTSTKILAMSIGGGSTVQPSLAYGFLVNTLGPGAQWNCGLCLLDGVATAAMQVGTSVAGNNAGSMPILMYSRSNAGDVDSGVFYTDPDGNFIVHPGFTTSGAATNPQTLIQDASGNILAGFLGAVGATPRVQMGNGVLLQYSSFLFSALPAAPNASVIYCSDCTPAAVCAGGGTGAPATRVNSTWVCGNTVFPGPYSEIISSLTTKTILASTHGRGTTPVATCLDGATPKNIVLCAYTRNLSGDLVFSFTPAFSGTLEVRQ